MQTVQVERRTSPFNGIERSLSRAVVIKTKSLPISATTFPTALSLQNWVNDLQFLTRILTSFKGFYWPKARRKDVQKSSDISVYNTINREEVRRSRRWYITLLALLSALSLYIAEGGRKHKHNPTLSAKKRVVQICRSSLSAAADGLADGSRWALNLAFQRRRTKRKWHWTIAQSCRSPTVSARLRYHVSNSVVCVHRAGSLRKDIRYPGKLFSKAEPFPFEKEKNINLVYSSCLKHANEMVLGDPRQAHQRTQSLHFPSSFINH